MGNPKRDRQKANRQQKVSQQWKVHNKRQRRNQIVGIFILITMVGTLVGAAVLAATDDSSQQLDLSADDMPDVDIDPDDPDPDDPDGTTDTTDGPTVTQVDTYDCPEEDGSSPQALVFDSIPATCVNADSLYRATIETTKGTMVWELDPSVSPVTVNNFVFLSRYHFYDGVTFHRIIPNFVVQGGDPIGDPPGTGGPGYTFGEVPGFSGEVPEGYEIGDVAMANSGSNPANSGSQFFVITGDNGAALDPNFALLGKVVEGMDVALELEAAGSPSGSPTEEVSIITVEIEEVTS